MIAAGVEELRAIKIGGDLDYGAECIFRAMSYATRAPASWIKSER